MAKADTAVAAPPMEFSPEGLRKFYQEINGIDEKLDAASGSAKAGRRAVTSQLIAAHQEQVTGYTDSLNENLANLDDETLVAIVSGIQKFLEDQYDDRVDGIVDERIAANKSAATEVKLSDEETAALLERRRSLLKTFDALRTLLSGFPQYEEELGTIPDPKRRTGPRGSRGPRLLSQYDYFVDGEEVPGNSLAAVVALLPGIEKVEELKVNFEGQGWNRKAPGDEFEYEVSGKTVKGVKNAALAVDDTDEEEEVTPDPNEESETPAEL